MREINIRLLKVLTLRTFTCGAFAWNSGQCLECGATYVHSWREKQQGVIVSPQLLAERRIISLRKGALERERDRRGEKKDDHLQGKESKDGWNVRLDRCLEVLCWRSGPVYCRERGEEKWRPRLGSGRIARHQEGWTVGRVTGVWTQTWEKAGFDTRSENLLNHVVAALGLDGSLVDRVACDKVNKWKNVHTGKVEKGFKDIVLPAIQSPFSIQRPNNLCLFSSVTYRG